MLLVLFLCTLVADPSQWWDTYGDPVLTSLVKRAEQANLDVRKALARVAEARALAGQARSALAPSIHGNASAQQLRGGFQNGIIRVPQSGPGGVSSLISPFETGLLAGSADMRWELSFWGSNGKLLNAAHADRLAAEESANQIRVIVAAEVARSYFEWRGTEQLLAVLERNRERQADLLELTRQRTSAGLSTQLDVDRQTAVLAAIQAEIPGVQSLRQSQLHRLAVLLADRNFASQPPKGEPARWIMPPLGNGVDSALLLRRPDVRAAQARILAAAARLRAAKADLYPRVMLTGLAGRQATNISGFSLGGGNFFGIGPQLVLPIFTGGRLRANMAASDARLEAAKLEYEQEVLAAFQEAEDAIAAYRAEQVRLMRLSDAYTAAQSALALAQDVYQAGLGDFLGVLDAQRTVLELDRAIAEARTSVMVQSVLLFKALAGGWPPAN